MKDALPSPELRPFTARRGGPGRDLVRVSERAPCPVCRRPTLCLVDTRALRVWCARESAGSLYATERGRGLRELFVHALDGSRAPAFERERERAPSGDVERAEPGDLDAVYRALLGLLGLEQRDAEGLRARGLGDEHIAAGLYRTWPERGRAALARKLVDRFGAELVRRVPGFVWRVDPANPSRGWWGVAGFSGLAVPCLDLDGRAVSLRIRRRDPIEHGHRYHYVTSAPGGPSALASVHVPAEALALRPAPLIITEGEMKAHAATALSGRPVVSVPGVGNWRRGVELAASWGAPRATVAFDADARTNPDVARHTRDLLRALDAAGVAPSLLSWPASEGNGLDDVLLARRRARHTPETPAT